jgi:dihydrodipicolinate synthase/N-acetylneuraminate lyase
MGEMVRLPEEKLRILQGGRIFVPSPLALDEQLNHDEAYQRLLTLYYIRAGAAAVIPGAHTGEFALGNLEIFSNWLVWVKEMVGEFGENMILIAAISGKNFMKQAEIAADTGYDLVLVAPTTFTGKNPGKWWIS